MGEKRDGFFMVWCENGGAPTHRHATYEDADVEAKRLSRLARGKVFFVLRAVGGRYLPAPDEPSEVELSYDDGLPF